MTFAFCSCSFHLKHMFKWAMMLMSLKSYFSFWSETTGAADVVAVKPCVGVPLTHCLQIHLRHLQNQTQLLAEQQLQGYAESTQDEHMHQVGVKKKYNMLHFWEHTHLRHQRR